MVLIDKICLLAILLVIAWNVYDIGKLKERVEKLEK
jgi:hypothetical protein